MRYQFLKMQVVIILYAHHVKKIFVTSVGQMSTYKGLHFVHALIVVAIILIIVMSEDFNVKLFFAFLFSFRYISYILL